MELLSVSQLILPVDGLMGVLLVRLASMFFFALPNDTIMALESNTNTKWNKVWLRIGEDVSEM